VPRLFTLPEVWVGAEFGLSIDYEGATTDQLRMVHDVVWTCPGLSGPYERKDVEPEQQELCAFVSQRPLYGVIELPPGPVPCWSRAFSALEDIPAFFEFGIPMGSLELFYDTGGWPFGQGDSLEWRDVATRRLFDISCRAYDRVPFQAAIIEHDPHLENLPPVEAPVPDRRWGAIVRIEHGSPVLYPATEGHPYTF
jgi:hypothetical protein